ncbi:transketolase [Glycomyces sp. NEAU-S30]|uniref:Transketolase n=2 Tax=Glycomyces niveus TaxID=2820287 RepID=A0ABS3U7V1_9ACTN|nr:transketolase C-terminal domain-containing protein [Glycomyces sp. NEAU-S30]MBO3734859.1 transketolase [Glycomyces sp. NEAU-S30]
MVYQADPLEDDLQPLTMRDAWAAHLSDLVDADPRLAVVLADISSDMFTDAMKAHPDRVINVGIREQLLIGAAGGLALAGMRPVAHTYAPFLIERAFEQVKLDFEHQGTSGVLVTVGASYDWAEGSFTHFSPRDVALFDTLPGWRVFVPGHAAEVPPLLDRAVQAEDGVYIRLSLRHNENPYAVPDGKLLVLREGKRATVAVVGPLLDNVLEATADLDVTVAYTNTPRPLDTAGLRELAAETGDAIVVVEPYLEGTSAWLVSRAYEDRPHRLLSLGVGREELRRYGTAAEHERLHGLDAEGIRARVRAFLA